MTTITFPEVKHRRQRTRRARQIDWPLVVGVLFFGALLLLAVYGPLAAPHDLYYSRALIDGKAPPFPSSAEYPFGSDSVGRDRFSWLLIGARGSVLIALSAAALRVLIGGSLGLIAGFRGGALASVLRRIALGLSSVPGTIATLLAVIALGLGPEQFVLAFGLIGWAEPFHQARRYTRSESARPFMESARSLGLSDRRLLFRHLLPNIAPQLLITAAFQVSAVLLLMGELALLNIFVGGAFVVDYDSRGLPIFAPRIPNWASMLATTRPIVSLFGDLPSVLLPGGALLTAVLATNLFGDALAARAQRLDVYRLVSRRQLVVLLTLTVLIALSVRAWPSRLAGEIEYARGFDGASTGTLARELAALGPRPNGSTGAEGAAVMLAGRLDGTIVRGTDTIIRARAADLVISAARLPVDALSLDNIDAEGPLVYMDVLSLLSGRAPDITAGAVVLLSGVAGPSLQRLADAQARAVIVLGAVNLPRAAGLYPLPVVSTTRAAVTAVLGRSLPNLRAGPLRYQLLAGEARLHIETERIEAPIADVVARVSASAHDAPVVVLVARYDSAPGTSSTWDTATSAAMLVTVIAYLREHALPLEVIALATSGDHQNYAGLRLGLAQLQADEQSRVQAILLLGPQLSDAIVLETQALPGVPSGVGRMAARLEDAFGAQLSPQVDPDLLRAIGIKVAALPLSIAAPGPDLEPGNETLRLSATVLLTALAYVPSHATEMR